MKKKQYGLGALLVGLCFSVLLMAGCMSSGLETQDEGAKNREYMSQVNQIMDDINAELTDFTEAVSSSDLVGMKTQSEDAFKAIEELKKLEAPEALKSVHDEYVSGCEDLEQALSGYIEIYAEMETATEEQPYDYSGYSEQLKKIEKKYEGGIEHLKEADKTAAELE